ncbi:MAG: FtsQ-type POTRA domain-containing protein [Gemmatimonadota bacterium]|jgi:cell division septal protein FtsQ
MRRDLRIILVTAGLAAVWAFGSRVSNTVTSMKAFRVTNVDVRGLDYLSRSDVLRLLDLPSGTSVWADTEPWERRLARSALIKRVHVGRQIPGTLVVDVTERSPVALVPTPTLVPVDEDGVRLPVDPAERHMDLPVLEPSERPVPGARLLPTHDRELAAEVGRLMETDTTFLQLVSEVAWQGPNTVAARWSEPQVEFLLRPGAPSRRIREGLMVLGDFLGREPGEVPAVIDLRYEDQVVVRRHR